MKKEFKFLLDVDPNDSKEVIDFKKEIKGNMNDVIKLLNVKRSDDSVNLYLSVLDRLAKLNIRLAENMKSDLLKIDSNLENRINIVQKFTISNYLLEVLYRLKGINRNINVNNAILDSNYTVIDDIWLESITKVVLPTINNILSLGGNDERE